MVLDKLPGFNELSNTFLTSVLGGVKTPGIFIPNSGAVRNPVKR
jgi:hypothetical protein